MKYQMIIALTFVSIAYAGPYKISINGDTIIHEGTEATYTITVQNTHNKNCKDMVVKIDGLQESGLKFCSAMSEDLEIFTNTVDDQTHVEGFKSFLPIGKTVTLSIKVRAAPLKHVGDLHSQELTIEVKGTKFKRARIKREATIFKAS